MSYVRFWLLTVDCARMAHPVSCGLVSLWPGDLNKFIKPLVKPSFEEYGVNAIRQLQEAYRFMVAHAFLNIYNREIKDNKIIVNSDYLKVAKYLIDMEIETIFQIVDALSELNRRGIRTYKQLREWQDRKRIQEICISCISYYSYHKKGKTKNRKIN